MNTISTRASLATIILLFGFLTLLRAEDQKIDTKRGDKMISEYFRAETATLSEASLADIHTKEDWEKRQKKYRGQLFEMLGLDPLPARTPLKATTTGKVEHKEFTVENVHFQSRPGLYVTGNLYLPKNQKEAAPAILYVCGHGGVKKNGVIYGNKVHYQHHGGWFARNGYVCLVIDTLQLGEIEGIHHGTYNHDMWWWPGRGYTSAGVEAWNCIRALDYLETRKEVDPKRFGVTGRSGGGAYSWWIAALDERIQVAVPVAGITDLTNHVVDGTVEGHCDCMFQVNTYRWDYAQVAALVAPRPLLISNTDRDRIFPLDGVVRTYFKVRKIYELYGVPEKIALQITSGPHKDTQELRVHAFHWFNHFLKNDDSLIETTAVKFFEPEQLKVFDKLPEDERNSKIQEEFTQLAKSPEVPESAEDWTGKRNALLKVLREKSFRGWPSKAVATDVRQVFATERDGIALSAYDFTSQENVRLRVYLAHRAGLKDPSLVVLNVLDPESWNDFLATYRPGFGAELNDETLPEADRKSFEQTQGMFKSFKWAMAYVAPRGVGPTAWDQSVRKQTQHRRRFHLLGQTLDGMRVWDTRRAIIALRGLPLMKQVPLWLQSQRQMAGVALYASLFEPNVVRLDLHDLPASHRDGPIFLNARRFLDLPEAVAMATERSQVRIYPSDDTAWQYPLAVSKKLGWNAKQIQVRRIPAKKPAKKQEK